VGEGQHEKAGGRLHRGVTAPPGKRMGHAGAIISGGKGTAQEKLAVMEASGIKVTRNPAEMGKLLQSVL
jgi:succinyl-CoA synthetase alpha subunit